jgi:hypothetical protein
VVAIVTTLMVPVLLRFVVPAGRDEMPSDVEEELEEGIT